MKRCSSKSCRKILPLNEFGKDKSTKDGLYHRCKTCENKRRKTLKYKEVRRNCNYKTNYNITIEDYEEMNKSQRGKCALCNRAEKNKKTTRLSVDHNHITEKIRGLLCNRCNRSLGILGLDDKNSFHKLRKYLSL